MSDIKAVIQLLCQHLNILLKVNLKPENFRLAKFNNNDEFTIHELWTTLQKMCLALGPTIPPNAKCTTHIWVKLQMASKGYKCAEFYGLPPDNSSGSRELLLSLMWIVAKENALAVLTQECVRQSPLCQEYSDAPQQKVLTSGSGPSLMSNEGKKSLNIEDQINYSLWLANRIKHNINQIHDFEEERIKHTHQVHEATAGSSGLPHLSVFETKLVKDADLLNKWMPKLSELNDLLNIHVKWLKKKSVFWEWMTSVVELKEKECGINAPHQPFHEGALTDFGNALQLYGGKGVKSQGPEKCGVDNFPRFFISSCFVKSASNLVRKASSSDLLADLGINDNGVVIQASDWLAQIDSELQEVEKLKQDKIQELNSMLQSLTQKLGLVAISDVSSGEAESEDCSK